MAYQDRELPEVGKRYASREKRSSGKLAEVIEPAPMRYGFVHLQWIGGRKSRMRTWYFWDRFTDAPSDLGAVE